MWKRLSSKKIYIGHSGSYNFVKELYEPIRSNDLNNKFNIILPHENGREMFNSKELFQTGRTIFIAEVSYPSIGLGIEIGWASLLKVPIVCMSKKGSKITSSLRKVTNRFVEYRNKNDLLIKLEEILIDSV